MVTAAYFYEKADHMLRLVKHVRARGIDVEDLCAELEALANEFMRKAVELDENASRRAL